MSTQISQVLALTNISTWSKKDLSELATASVDEVADNGEDVLGLLALSAKLEFYAGEVKKAAKSRGIADLARYGKAGFAKGGVKLQVAETGVSYDYSHDPAWQLRKADETAKTVLRKEWEDVLRSLPTGGMVISDPDTGELYHAYPPAKTGQESIKATIL